MCYLCYWQAREKKKKKKKKKKKQSITDEESTRNTSPVFCIEMKQYEHSHHHYSDQNDQLSIVSVLFKCATEIISPNLVLKTNKHQTQLAALCTFCLHKH